MTIVTTLSVSQQPQKPNRPLIKGAMSGVSKAAGKPDQSFVSPVSDSTGDSCSRQGSGITPLRIFPNYVKKGTSYQLRYISE